MTGIYDELFWWFLFASKAVPGGCLRTSRSLSNIMMSGSKASDVYMDSVMVAVDKGLEECKHQFKWEPWSCPKTSFNIFSKNHHQPATKEMGFVRAIISSSIVITLTRNCSLGHYNSCGCDDTKRGDLGYKGWKWGGCSDNLKIGNRMAKHFLDSRENGRDLKNLINLHNNRVGRMMVKKTMNKMCKCHGVSGSCEVQTCWMSVRDIREVGNHLKHSYDTARPFDTNRNGFLPPPLPRHKRKNSDTNSVLRRQASGHHERLKFPKTQLIYLETSPDYCHANESAGIPGTLGRQCSRRTGQGVSESEKNSCKTLCRGCGYRVQMRTAEVETTCKCKFHWCCKVRCKTCINEVVQHTCVRSPMRFYKDVV